MKPLLITSGEPAGIGPDICLALAGLDIPVVVMGDRQLLQQRADQLNMTLELYEYDRGSAIKAGRRNALAVYPIPLRKPVTAGKLDPHNAPYVIEILHKATDACLQGEFSAVVTAPVHKAVINDYGIAFSGHTEFFALHCNVPKVVMMLVSEGMKVALVTTHLPLGLVPKAITGENLRSSIQILHTALQTDFHIDNPRILIAGLNPHAGENGHLGFEEQRVMQPVIRQMQEEGWLLEGPMPADTMFTTENNVRGDAYLCMYHDQGLPIIKYTSFGKAVNVTLGLPIIRTSVDHGTALTLAATGHASSTSLVYAVNTAWNMAKGKQQ